MNCHGAWGRANQPQQGWSVATIPTRSALDVSGSNWLAIPLASAYAPRAYGPSRTSIVTIRIARHSRR